MKPSEKVSAAIRAARGGTAIVAFVTAGYPSREKFREQLMQIGNEADVVSVGISKIWRGVELDTNAGRNGLEVNSVAPAVAKSFPTVSHRSRAARRAL